MASRDMQVRTHQNTQIFIYKCFMVCVLDHQDQNGLFMHQTSPLCLIFMHLGHM